MRTGPAALIALVSLGLATPLTCQTIRGTASEEGTGVRLHGALIALVPADGDSVHVGVLTGRNGEFTLRAPPGRWRLRAEQIGHRSVLSAPFHIGATGSIVVDLEAPVEAVPLPAVEVSAGGRGCVARPDEGASTARVWEEARKALENARWSRESVIRFETLLYDRLLDPSTLRVRDETTETRRGAARRPFRSLTPEALAESGYVQPTDSGTYYHAPDETVLLSRAFLDGHCFRLQASDRDPELVGLAFEPVGGGRTVDIRGVLWLDAASRELRTVEYQYANLRLDVPTDDLGGRVEFQRLPTGAWIPRRWWIRMPVMELRRTRGITGGREETVLTGLLERGGEVVALETRADGRITRLDRARIQGLTWDSTRQRPLTDARVFLVGTDHQARTDERGRFALAAPDGDYELGFHHPRLDTLGFQPPPTPVALRSGVVRQVRLAVPAPETLLAYRCRLERPGTVVTGTVEGIAPADPASDLRVRIAWTDGQGQVRERETVGDQDGRFTFCGVPPGVELFARALERGRTGPTVRTTVESGPLTRLELRVDTLRTGQLTGQVLDAATGRPVRQAALRVRGTGLQALTDEEGRFLLMDVPPGPQLLELAHVAYGTRSDTVRVQPDSSLALTVAVLPGAIALEPLTVTAERRALTPGLAGFYERAERGQGVIITAEQIERRQAHDLSDVLRAVPGLGVVCGNSDVLGSGCEIQFDRARALTVAGRERVCPVQFFLDGTSTSQQIVEALQPRDILGIEVYNGLSEVPPRFRRGPDTRCGVIVVWTKAMR